MSDYERESAIADKLREKIRHLTSDDVVAREIAKRVFVDAIASEIVAAESRAMRRVYLLIVGALLIFVGLIGKLAS